MDFTIFHQILLVVQKSISFCGVLVILSGVIISLIRYIGFQLNLMPKLDINSIRLRLGRVLVLGLEFIVAADLIGTTTAPDYYSVGIVAIIVVIRTGMSFSLNREINELSKQEGKMT